MNKSSAPFTVLGVAAIIIGGLIAAATAHQPTQHLMWVVGYLVLVVGVAQCVLGEGQARLAADPPIKAIVRTQWLLFNIGNIGVIVGTLTQSFGLLAAGTILFALAMVWFSLGIRGGGRSIWRICYLALVLVLLVSSLVGLFLSVIDR